MARQDLPPPMVRQTAATEWRANLPPPKGEPRNPTVAIGTIQRQEILSDQNSRTPTNIDAAASTKVSETVKHRQRPPVSREAPRPFDKSALSRRNISERILLHDKAASKLQHFGADIALRQGGKARPHDKAASPGRTTRQERSPKPHLEHQGPPKARVPRTRRYSPRRMSERKAREESPKEDSPEDSPEDSTGGKLWGSFRGSTHIEEVLRGDTACI